MEFINMGPAYIKGAAGRGMKVGWVMAKTKTKNQDDTNIRVQSGYDIHLYPQRTNIPLQGLDRCALTMGAISGPHCQIGTLHWHHFTSCGLMWVAKSTLEKQTD